MCVIAYKAKDVRFFSDSSVRDMWEHNSDGAGIMWRDPATNEISFVKGFMKLKSLKKWIRENRKWLEDVECALHFRITTHGGTMEGNCHPFVVDENADSHLLNGSAKRVMMHNGVLRVVPRREDISDTAELALRLGKFSNPAEVLSSVDEQLSGNRILLMDESGTHFFGDKFIKSSKKDCEGILYSNLNHEFCSDYGGFWSSDFGLNNVKSKSNGNPDDKPGAERYCCAYYDESKNSFIDVESGESVSYYRVDPDSLSEEDYEIWLGFFEESETDAKIAEDYGLDISEYRYIKNEANYAGMSFDDYYRKYWLGDDEWELDEQMCVA